MERDVLTEEQKLLGEIAILRILVESLMACLDPHLVDEVLLQYRATCERLQGQLLGTEASDAALRSVDRAIEQMANRLKDGGIAPPEQPHD